jgi:hypothetical protein
MICFSTNKTTSVNATIDNEWPRLIWFKRREIVNIFHVVIQTVDNTSRYPKYSVLMPPSIQQLWQREAPVPTGQTVKSGLFCDVLRRLRENVRRSRPELWREQTWLLHHYNAPSHTSVLNKVVSGEKQNRCHPPPTVIP